MNKDTIVLFFDTETSGFISKSKSASDPEQAWCVQIGAILATQEEDLEKLNVIIKADGREMNWHAEQIHGISVEKADREGIPEVEAAEKFGRLLRTADLIVCHNFDFDWAYVKHMLERNLDTLSDEARSAFFLDLPSFCTMKDKTVMKWVNARNAKGRLKWPKLIELYEKVKSIKPDWDFTFTEDDTHDAFADIDCTKRCFFELVNLDVIKLELITPEVDEDYTEDE